MLFWHICLSFFWAHPLSVAEVLPWLWPLPLDLSKASKLSAMRKASSTLVGAFSKIRIHKDGFSKPQEMHPYQQHYTNQSSLVPFGLPQAILHSSSLYFISYISPIARGHSLGWEPFQVRDGTVRPHGKRPVFHSIPSLLPGPFFSKEPDHRELRSALQPPTPSMLV